MARIPHKQEVTAFLKRDSPLFHLLELYLADQRRQLLERFPSQRQADDFARLQAQISYLDLLLGGLREDVGRFYGQIAPGTDPGEEVKHD